MPVIAIVVVVVVVVVLVVMMVEVVIAVTAVLTGRYRRGQGRGGRRIRGGKEKGKKQRKIKVE